MASAASVLGAARASLSGASEWTPPDGRKYHMVVATGSSFKFAIDTRYTNLKFIGGGAYGSVAAAEDTLTGRKVAIKKVADVFRDLGDAKRILRELKLLRHLGGHENIIWILVRAARAHVRTRAKVGAGRGRVRAAEVVRML
ncbi:hypothetical protein EON62_06230 [archaeon]|nr:MAG: hypothetical protein EON62_06230 [archaeon]